MKYFIKPTVMEGPWPVGNVEPLKGWRTRFKQSVDATENLSVKGNLVRVEGVPRPSFPSPVEDNDYQSVTSNLSRATDEEVQTAIGCGQLPVMHKARQKGQEPDTSKGLGKQEIKRDIVNLEKFVRDELLFAIVEGTLCLYSAPCWKRLDERIAKMIVRSCLEEHNLADYLTERECAEIYRLLLIDKHIERKHPFRSHDGLLNLADGTLDVISDCFLPHDPEDGFFDFIDLGLAEVKDPPNQGENFERFMALANQWHPAVGIQILELIAFAIMGYSVKHFYALLGPTGTGKSQLGRFLRELVGKENVMNVQDIGDFGGRFTCGSLADKKLAMCLDLQDAPLPREAIGVIKQMVGDDAVKGERKYHDPFTFDNKPLLLFAGNYAIRIPNISRETALVDRMVIIPMMYRANADEEVFKLYEIFLQERGHIISRALDAFRSFAESGKCVTRVPVPPDFDMEEGSAGARAVQVFVETRCEYAENAEISTKALAEAYNNYGDGTYLTEIEFARQLNSALQTSLPDVVPVKRANGSDRRGYRGLRLL